MLYVTSLDGLQVEPLTNFNNFEMKQEVNGTFTVSLTSLNLESNPAHSILLEESIITVADLDFRVKQITELLSSKQIVANHIFYDLVDERQDTTFAGTHTFSEFAEFTLQNTGWMFTTDITEYKLIPNFGNANIISLINTLCSVYSCEYEIKSNNHIHFAYQIGGDYNAQYRYKHNIKALSKHTDTTKLKTYIEGYGANGLYVPYTSPNSSTFGIRKADPIIDDNISESDILLEKIKSELVDYPEVSFQLDSVELTNKELGDRVWLIYEPLNIEFQTRILSQIKEFRNGQLVTKKVTLGNVIPQTTANLLVSQKIQIDENKKQTQSKFEQTNNRITMEVETIGQSIAQLEITDSQIQTSVTNLETSMNSKITQTANEIRSEVSATKSELESDISVVSQTATQIQSTVTSQGNTINSLGTRISGAESSITQLSNEIELKVSETDFTGNSIVSKINLSSTSIKLQASRIEFYGQVFGQGATFSGDISTDDDIYVGNNIYMQGSSGGRISLPHSSCQLVIDSGGSVTLEAYNDLELVGSDIYLYGDVHFEGDVDGVALSDTSGLGFGYSSSSNRLYVRINGSNVGYVDLL